MTIEPAAMIVVLAIMIVVVWQRRRKRSGPQPIPKPRPRTIRGVGPGASGTIYELLNEEKRNAIEIIVEEKAAYKEAEHADGNLPDLEKPFRVKP